MSDPVYSDVETESLKGRLNELFLRYCQKVEVILPLFFELLNIKKEIEAVVANLSEKGIVFDVESYAKEIGIDLESLQKVVSSSSPKSQD